MGQFKRDWLILESYDVRKLQVVHSSIHIFLSAALIRLNGLWHEMGKLKEECQNARLVLKNKIQTPPLSPKLS